MFFLIKKINEKGQGGFSIVEVLIYAFILTLVVFFSAQSIIGLVRSHSVIALDREVEYSSQVGMNNIVSEIRGASSASVVGSTLSLSGTKAGVGYTTVFSLQNGQLVFSKDGGANTAITSSKVSVSSLVFRVASTTNSTGVKIDMTVAGTRGNYSRTLNLSDYAILRGSY